MGSRQSPILCVCVWVCSPMDCSPLGSSVHGFPRREYWRELPFPTAGIFLDQGSVLHIVSIACICQSHLPFQPITIPPHLGIHAFVHYNLRLLFLWLCAYSGSGLWITGHLAASVAPAHWIQRLLPVLTTRNSSKCCNCPFLGNRSIDKETLFSAWELLKQIIELLLLSRFSRVQLCATP